MLNELAGNDVDSTVIKAARELQSENPKVLATNTDVARVLCGLSSPAISKARLAKHNLFGSCAEIAFAAVLARLATNTI